MSMTAGANVPGSALPVGGIDVQAVAIVDQNGNQITTFSGGGASTIADGADVTLGAKADAKSTATDTTPITAMSVLKQISASVQAPPSQAVTNAGTFAVQAAVADGANVVEGATTGAAVITDANGTIQQYLRGLIKLIITAGSFLVTTRRETTSWTAINVSGSGSQATATKASAGGGVKNVCTGFTVTIAAGSTAPAATQITVGVIDGASGGGTYVWRSAISIPAVAGTPVSINRGDLWLPGTAATAMTIEFSAGIANTVQSVSMEGTTSL